MEEIYYEEIKVPVKKEKKPETKEKMDEEKSEEKKEEKKEEGDSKMAEETKAEEEFTIEKKKKTRITDVKFTSNLNHNDSKEVFENFYALEGKMCYKDKLVRETVSTKNTLESLIYDSRDKLQSEWKVYTKDSDKKQILDLAQKTEDWLYDEGMNVSKDMYLEKLENLTKLVNPVKNRMDNYIKMRNGLDYAHNKFNYYQQIIPSNPEKFDHLTPEDVQVITNNIQNGTAYFSDVQKKLQNAKLDMDPPVKFDDMIAKMNEIEKECDKILNKPKPAPKKEEKKEKTEETKNEQPEGDKDDGNKMSEENMEKNPGDMDLEKND